jgi:hypothetical protein
MPIRRVVRVKSCNANKNQECFLAKRNSRKSRSVKPRRVSKPRSRSRRISRRSKPRRSKPRRSKPRRSRSRRVSRRSKPRRSRSRRSRPQTSRKRSSYRGLVISKSPDVISQIKNFVNIDQEITYMIKHPRKANRKNVLKLLAMLLLLLAFLCGLMKMLGGNFDYCTPITDGIKKLISDLRSGALSPIDAIKNVRNKMGELFKGFKELGPVKTALEKLSGLKGKLGGKLGGLGSKLGDLFKEKPEEAKEPPAPAKESTKVPPPPLIKVPMEVKKEPIHVGSNMTFGELEKEINKRYEENESVKIPYILGLIDTIKNNTKSNNNTKIGKMLDSNKLLNEYVRVD